MAVSIGTKSENVPKNVSVIIQNRLKWQYFTVHGITVACKTLLHVVLIHQHNACIHMYK